MLLPLLLACHDPSGPHIVPDVVDPSSRRLRADATRIVDGSGEEVVLRGVNLGGWMFHETWITAVDYPTWGRVRAIGREQGLGDDVDAVLRELGPTEDLAAIEAALAVRVGPEVAAAVRGEAELYPSVYDDSDLPLRQLLETRFGTDGRDALIDAFAGAWVGEADVAWLADQGFNLVRVPMGYRTLTTGSDLAPPTSLDWNEAALARLDALLDACAAHGVYAVLDLQESPGGHNDYSGPGTLYDDPAMQALTVELWRELSRRYADRDEVAAYSLLAEPMSAPSMDASVAMYDQLHDAIRAQGDDHLLVVHDGFMGMWALPPAAEMEWSGVVYSTHLFEWGAESQEDYTTLIQLYDTMFANAQETQQVPYFIGSFSTMEDEEWAYASLADLLTWYEERGFSWAWWTYKRIDDPDAVELWGETTAWGLRREAWDGFERPDVWRDDEATLRAKLEAYDGEMAINARLVETLGAAAR